MKASVIKSSADEPRNVFVVIDHPRRVCSISDPLHNLNFHPRLGTVNNIYYILFDNYIGIYLHF